MRRAMEGPVYNLLKNRITAELSPSFLIIEDESYKHKSRGEKESHFKVCVVSEKFQNVSTIERHRLVNKVSGFYCFLFGIYLFVCLCLGRGR
jgi:BolA protein